MAIGNIPARKRGFGYDPVTRSLGVYTDGQLTASFPPTPGRTYFVNNITGSATNDGLSWGTAMDEVSTAVTASETYRQLGGEEGGRSVTTNDYVRNTIIVQGTGTAYTALTTLPLYCDLVGLGADPRGTGAGIARIGSDSVAGYAVTCTDTIRGLNVYNIQFQGGASNYIFTIENMYRSTFTNCAFMTPGVATGHPTAAFHSSVNSGSLVFDHCLIGGSSCSKGTESSIGMMIAGTGWTNCLVENCFISGLQGVTVASTVVSNWGSMFKNNFIGQSPTTCSIGVNDDSVSGSGYIIYAGNYFQATAPFDIENNTARAIGNYWKGALITGANA